MWLFYRSRTRKGNYLHVACLRACLTGVKVTRAKICRERVDVLASLVGKLEGETLTRNMFMWLPYWSETRMGKHLRGMC